MKSLQIISAHALVAVAVVTLSGCGILNPVGEPKFDCNRNQDAKSVYCKSFKSVEASTNGDLPPSRFDKEFNLSDRDRLLRIAPDADVPTPPQSGSSAQTPSAATTQVPSPSAALLPHQIQNAPALAGQPVREGPVVQRTWIKRFRDENDSLVDTLFVYKEIRGTRWSGFDQIANSSSTQTYPRKPAPERTVDTTPTPSKAAASAPDATPQFKQPGINAGSPESAPFPAVSGNTTMPQ